MDERGARTETESPGGGEKGEERKMGERSRDRGGGGVLAMTGGEQGDDAEVGGQPGVAVELFVQVRGRAQKRGSEDGGGDEAGEKDFP